MAGLGGVGSRIGLSRLGSTKRKARAQIRDISRSKERLYHSVEVSFFFNLFNVIYFKHPNSAHAVYI